MYQISLLFFLVIIIAKLSLVLGTNNEIENNYSLTELSPRNYTNPCQSIKNATSCSTNSTEHDSTITVNFCTNAIKTYTVTRLSTTTTLTTIPVCTSTVINVPVSATKELSNTRKHSSKLITTKSIKRTTKFSISHHSKHSSIKHTSSKKHTTLTHTNKKHNSKHHTSSKKHTTKKHATKKHATKKHTTKKHTTKKHTTTKEHTTTKKRTTIKKHTTTKHTIKHVSKHDTEHNDPDNISTITADLPIENSMTSTATVEPTPTEIIIITTTTAEPITTTVGSDNNGSTTDNNVNASPTTESKVTNSQVNAKNDESNKALGIGLGVGIGCIAALGLAGLLVYNQRNKGASNSRSLNSGDQVNTRWRPQSFMGVVASVVSRLPRSPSQRSKTSTITEISEPMGIAIGHGNGAIEGHRQY